MYSLKKKLTRSLVINMILLMLLLLGGLSYSIQQLLKDHVLSRLQHDADSLVSLIQQDQAQHWSLNPAHMSTIYSRVRSGHYYAINIRQQKIRSRSLFDFEVPFRPISADDYAQSYQMQGVGEESWLVWQQRVHRNNQSFELWVAEDMTPVYRNLLRFFGVAVLIILSITFVSIYLQQRILNRAFSIFDALRLNLQDIRHGKPEQAMSQVPLEVLPLVQEIKTLVEQLRQRIARTRNAIGNLSHEIKRPLQIVSLQLDQHKSPSGSKALDEIRGIVDRELRRARISGASVAVGVVNLREECAYLLEVMQKIYPTILIRLQLQPESMSVSIDRDDLLELLGNLLDNACKFAESAVSIEISNDSQQLTIKVEDDGPGVAPDQALQITTKGLRLDETVEGHGLGLSICADILHSYHGSLSFDDAELGGLKALAVIPLTLN
ncbi:MAG: sensor histidine kinase [Gammaproteobacteria bacterium]|nr:sensor histidine kinase [Gammaproteobacteria bacterium]MBL6999093.1 sensor histidine kinase [Gammaproteobacteria bacterium]